MKIRQRGYFPCFQNASLLEKNPRLLFKQVEALLKIQTWCNNVIYVLEGDILKHVSAIVKMPPDTSRYYKFKFPLIESLREFKDRQLKSF